eukprot:TRINITY_DN7701_c0_g1_i1.p1 TRINITY_DN7701_c0_g1~~TRINITY_DN7701_c0_g1_i1.p1  ORF type:complete len:444 (+),score=90.95 TRINITY_DN7701_c0_g1_i1:46-1377(+)
MFKIFSKHKTPRTPENMAEAARNTATAFEKSMDKIERVSMEFDEKIMSALQHKLQHVDALCVGALDQLRTVIAAIQKDLSMKEALISQTKRRSSPWSKRSQSSVLSCVHAAQAFISFQTCLQKELNMHAVIHTPTIRSALSELISLSSGNADLPKGLIHTGLRPIHRDLRFDLTQIDAYVGNSTAGHEIGAPWGIAVHPFSGNIYVVDRNNDNIFILTPNLKLVSVHQTYEKAGAATKFKSPIGIAITNTRSIIVVEYNTHQMLILDENFQHIRTLGGHGKTFGKFCYPYFVQLDSDGCMYLSDNSNGCIHKYDPDGNILLEFAQANTDGAIGVPSGIAVLDDNTILAMGCGKGNIKQFRPDGTFIRQIDLQESTASGSYNYLARGPPNTFVLTDKGNGRVFVIDLEGKVIQRSNAQGPVGAVFGLNNMLYVAESTGKRIVMY